MIIFIGLIIKKTKENVNKVICVIFAQNLRKK